MSMWERRRMHPRGDEARDVRDVRKEQRADFIRNRAELREVDRSGISAISAEDHLRLVCLCLGEHGIEIDLLGLGIELIKLRLEKDRGGIELHPVRQMSPA